MTESLRRQWADQRAQSIEERPHDQEGRPRPPEAIWEEDVNVALMDALLALPLGSHFDGPSIQSEVRAAMRDLNAVPSAPPPAPPPAPAPASAPAHRDYGVPGLRVTEASETITFDVEVQAFEDDPWTVTASEFADETDAWGYIATSRAKPMWSSCFWRVTEVRRKTTDTVWGPTRASVEE